MVVSKLNEEMLAQIADITGGAYVRSSKQSIGRRDREEHQRNGAERVVGDALRNSTNSTNTCCSRQSCCCCWRSSCCSTAAIHSWRTSTSSGITYFGKRILSVKKYGKGGRIIVSPFGPLFGAIKDKRESGRREGSSCQYLTIKQTGKRLDITRCTHGPPLQKSLRGNFKQKSGEVQQKSSILLYLKRSLSSFKPISLKPCHEKILLMIVPLMALIRMLIRHYGHQKQTG